VTSLIVMNTTNSYVTRSSFYRTSTFGNFAFKDIFFEFYKQYNEQWCNYMFQYDVLILPPQTCKFSFANFDFQETSLIHYQKKTQKELEYHHSCRVLSLIIATTRCLKFTSYWVFFIIEPTRTNKILDTLKRYFSTTRCRMLLIWMSLINAEDTSPVIINNTNFHSSTIKLLLNCNPY
jgi:hypothetical protein